MQDLGSDEHLPGDAAAGLETTAESTDGPDAGDLHAGLDGQGELAPDVPADVPPVELAELMPEQWWQDTAAAVDDPGALTPLGDCSTFEPILRQRLIWAMEEVVDVMKARAMLVWVFKKCLGDNPGCTFEYNPECYNGGMVELLCCGDSAPAEGMALDLPPSPGPETFTGTNVQVKGVDEPDFIKTDGQYLYVVSGNALRIVKAWPPQDAQKVSVTVVEGLPRRLFLDGDRLVVFSALEPNGFQMAPVFECPLMSSFEPHGAQCTYGYDCDFTGDGHRALALVYDVSDRTAPKLLRRIDMAGAYMNSRRIGDAVFTFVEIAPRAIPGLVFWPQGWEEAMPEHVDLYDILEPDLPAAADKLFDDLKQVNRQLLLAAPLEDILPVGSDTVWNGDASTTQALSLVDCGQTYLSLLEKGGSAVALIGFDLAEGKPADVTSVLARPGAVYGSEDSMVMAVRHYPEHSLDLGAGGPLVAGQETVLHRFVIDADAASSDYGSTGLVPGRMLNQFAIDELDGYLRVATTTPGETLADDSNGIYVLAEGDGTMALVGKVEGIGLGEDIRSARFVGKVGYLVTFHKTDPLFVLDLSDPLAPAVAGEIVVPGFSTYLHPIDDAHLLTIGYDAEDMGAFSWFSGIRLQLFDVSDMGNPALVGAEVIGTRGTSTDAATNHLAFTWMPSEGRLALPMVVCEGGSDSTFGGTMTFNGLMVYHVTPDKGFDYLGGIPHELAEDPDVSCFNWWTKSGSQVKRSILMDDWVFSIALDEIRVAPIDSLGGTPTVVNLE